MTKNFDVAVIGGGIVGLAHAWLAAERGLRVVMLERNARAEGATVRNFGMIWPIGQPHGELLTIALRSRQWWLKLHDEGVLEIEPCGSIHVAHRDDELAVLNEFVELQKSVRTDEFRPQMLSAVEVLLRAPLVQQAKLAGGMFSNSELRVNPRTAPAKISQWLSESKSVAIEFDTSITQIEGNSITSSDGRNWQADRIVICSGSDLQSLFPREFAASELKLCKLQMLSVDIGAQQQVMPHIASGLTLRHYSSFLACPSLKSLQARIQLEAPELDRLGIHVMASIFRSGKVILGDSHEYGENISPFDKSEIDDFMIRELRKVVDLPNWNIREKWSGIYAKHPKLPIYEKDITDAVSIAVGTGGAGMTMSFGLAERAWNRWLGETSEYAL